MTNDGGPAYPRPTTQWSDAVSGMTLRDYFAGQALAGLLANPEVTRLNKREDGTDCVILPGPEIAIECADRLIAELAKETP